MSSERAKQAFTEAYEGDGLIEAEHPSSLANKQRARAKSVRDAKKAVKFKCGSCGAMNEVDVADFDDDSDLDVDDDTDD